MLARLAEVLASEGAAGRAVGAFTCYDATTAVGVIEAAELTHRSVALLLAERTLEHPHSKALAAALVGVAEAATVPIAIQSDHLRRLEQVERSFSIGIPSAMIDGSRLPLADNFALTRSAVDIARHHSGDVEAELGRIEGSEDVSTCAPAGAMTNPDAVEQFATDSGITCLAVSVGNVHGEYVTPPELDFERLRAIAAKCPVPLSMHGASGLPREVVRACINSGVRKFNVNTDLRMAVFGTLQAKVDALAPGYRLAELDDELVAAVSRAAARKLADFDPMSA
jgi:ketose-bisphosphate aldolase